MQVVNRVLREIVQKRYLYILALPGMLFLLIFAYIPMLGHLLAFKKFNIAKGFWGSDWVGLDNFKFFFSGTYWLVVTYNTVFLNVLFLVFGLCTALMLAILINEIRNRLYKRLLQSAILLPYFISWLVVSLMMFALLNTTDGLMNQFLEFVGLDRVAWYNTPNLWPSILTVVYMWKFTGYFSLIFMSVMAGLSLDYFESAEIDGASKMQQIRYITLPLLRPTIMLLTLLGIGRIFYGDFGMIFGIIGDNGVLFPTTDVIDTYSFRAMRQMGDFGMASAVILYQSIFGLCAILLFNAIARKIDRNSSLF